MLLPPREYQSRCFETVRGLVRRGVKRIVVVGPTGCGKTRWAAMVIEGAMAKGSRMLFLAHRKELIDQPSALLDILGIDHGVMKGKHWRNRPDAPIQVGSVQTLLRRTCPPAEVVFIDEGHRVLGNGYLEILAQYPDAVVIILTATPWRLDGRGLKDVATHLVVMAEVQDLIDQGHLAPLLVYAPETPDVTGLRVAHGDYDQRFLARRLKNDPKRVGKIVEHWQKLAENSSSIFYGVSVEDSQHVCSQFLQAGIPADHVDGKMSDGRREAAIGKLERGEIKVLCNCDVLTEGFDMPSLGCVMLGRPTMSLTMYLQQVGRAMRKTPDKKHAIIMDFAGCVHAHGLPTDPREWTLEDRISKRDRGDGPGLTVKCLVCGLVRAESTEKCPKCSPSQIEVFDRLPQEADADLVEFKSSYRCTSCSSPEVKLERTTPLQLKVTCKLCKSSSFQKDRVAIQQAGEFARRVEYNRLRLVQMRKNFKPGWVAVQYKETFGEWPPRDWMNET